MHCDFISGPFSDKNKMYVDRLAERKLELRIAVISFHYIKQVTKFFKRFLRFPKELASLVGHRP